MMELVEQRLVTKRKSWLHGVIAIVALGNLALAACSGPDAPGAPTSEPTARAEVTASANRPQPTGGTVPTPTAPDATGQTPTAGETPTSAATGQPASTRTAAVATATSVPPTGTPPPPPDLGAVALALEPVGPTFEQPVLVTHAADGSGRAFVAEKPGRIRLLDGTLYLDISARVLYYELLTVEHELGFVGLAFHPDFERNRTFFVHYTDKNQDHVVSRFTEGANGLGDPNSEQVLLTYDQPEVNFFAGTLAFGRDGYLYITMGTGTAVDADQDVAQQLDNLWGKILRIDVDSGDPYGIPADNPFVTTPGARPEVWAYGLRNPWRFAFDRLTNDLYIGGPGEFRREWIHFVAGGNAGGLNFGWPILEGDECWEAAVLPCETAGLEVPIIAHAHADQNCAMIGGAVYRGTQHPVLNGVYFYSDYCSGRIWGAARDDTGAWRTRELLDTQMLTTSFGEDEAGELYVIDGLSGTVYRLAASTD